MTTTEKHTYTLTSRDTHEVDPPTIVHWGVAVDVTRAQADAIADRLNRECGLEERPSWRRIQAALAVVHEPPSFQVGDVVTGNDALTLPYGSVVVREDDDAAMIRTDDPPFHLALGQGGRLYGVRAPGSQYRIVHIPTPE